MYLSVLIVCLLFSISIPLACAPPNHPCEPWPECKNGGEEPPADPAIAFVQTGKRSANKIMVMNDDGSNQALMYEGPFEAYGNPSWSPDGNSIAWSGPLHTNGYYEYGIWRIDVEVIDGVPQGSNLMQLAHSDGSDSFGSAAWSPLGDEIAYRVNPPGDPGERIDAVPATGGDSYTIYTSPDGFGIGRSVTWRSDGTQLALIGIEISAGADGKSIIIVDRATGTVTDTLLTGQFDFTRLDWAQGLDILAFHDMSTSMIYTVDIETGTSVPVTEGAAPSWSPDNSKLAYIEPGRQPRFNKISTVDLDTGEITRLASGINPDWRRF